MKQEQKAVIIPDEATANDIFPTMEQIFQFRLGLVEQMKQVEWEECFQLPAAIAYLTGVKLPNELYQAFSFAFNIGTADATQQVLDRLLKAVWGNDVNYTQEMEQRIAQDNISGVNKLVEEIVLKEGRIVTFYTQSVVKKLPSSVTIARIPNALTDLFEDPDILIEVVYSFFPPDDHVTDGQFDVVYCGIDGLSKIANNLFEYDTNNVIIWPKDPGRFTDNFGE